MVRRFEDILERVEEYNPGADFGLLRRAYVFSGREHRSQVRRSGDYSERASAVRVVPPGLRRPGPSGRPAGPRWPRTSPSS